MTARFAPADIGADCRTAARRRAAGAGPARRGGAPDGRAVPAPGLGRATTRCCSSSPAHAAPAAGPAATAAAARLHYFLINKGPWSRLDHNQPFVAGVAGQAGGGQLLSGRRDRRKKSRSGSTRCSGEAKAARHRLLHDDPPRRRRALHRGALHASSTRASWRGPRRCCARPPQLTSAADAQEVPHRRAPTRSSRTTTTRATSPGWSSTRRSSRPSARTRSTKTSGSTTRPRSRRSSRSATTPRRRSCRRSAAQLQELENALPIDPKLSQPEARRARADPRRQRRLRRRRRQPRRADRGLQPAERRARGQGEGHQARDAEERAGGEVPARCCCRSPRSRCPRRDQKNVVVRRLLHPHPDARADARPRPAQHHGRRRADDRPAGAEGDLQRDRGSQGGRLGPVGAAAPGRQEGARPGDRARRCTRRSSPRRSARSASASTRRTAAASPSS